MNKIILLKMRVLTDMKDYSYGLPIFRSERYWLTQTLIFNSCRSMDFAIRQDKLLGENLG